MKKFMILTSLLLVVSISTACADDEKTIDFTKLPNVAQQFISTHFPQDDVTHVTSDKDDYEVRLSNGTKIEFQKNGEWSDVDCTPNPVPASIVPEAIATYVTQNYPNAHIVQIDRDKRDYEIDLSNGLDLVFDLNGNFIRIDN